jgi:ADP-ribosylglycohydrolase
MDVTSSAATNERRRGLARACLLGGAVGDALGAPVEFLSLTAIRRQFGPAGVTELEAGDDPAGSITDDTQMTLFTAEGLLRAAVRAQTKGICRVPSVVCHAYLRWLQTQGIEPAFPLPAGPPGLLTGIPDLHAQRAPGNTCIEALRSMKEIRGEAAANTSKGCGGIMRVAPVGVWGARDGRGAVEPSFRLAMEIAALTHGHPTGALAAGTFAALVAQLMVGTAVRGALPAVISELQRYPDCGETLAALKGAIRAADQGQASAEAVERIGRGWVAEEALAIAVYCALVATAFEDGVLLAVNHSGDSDSTGSLAGNLLGVLHGEEKIPKRWLDRLELRNLISRVAEDLWDYPNLRSVGNVTGSKLPDRVWEVYPGY